ncbi:hypothetical protein F4804DRAFT_319243 [Jackrogersella minutella]|nr:hypothetical protein F4804DRAFT_319243 [Jackrogersella minutella]
MHWLKHSKREGASDDSTRAWALVFDEEDDKNPDLHFPRYLYFAKQEPRKWNRVRWRDIVTGSGIVEIGMRLYAVAARPPLTLELDTKDYAVADPSGSCLVASTGTIPTPLRTVYLGVVEHESVEYGCALIQLDPEYTPCELAGETMTGTALDIDRSWIDGNALRPQSPVDGRFWLRTVKDPTSASAHQDEYIIEVVGNRLTTRTEKFKGDFSVRAQDRGALVMSGENSAVGIALGLISMPEARGDPADQKKALRILPFDKLFWWDVVPRVSHLNPHEPIYRVLVDITLKGWR